MGQFWGRLWKPAVPHSSRLALTQSTQHSEEKESIERRLHDLDAEIQQLQEELKKGESIFGGKELSYEFALDCSDFAQLSGRGWRVQGSPDVLDGIGDSFVDNEDEVQEKKGKGKGKDVEEEEKTNRQDKDDNAECTAVGLIGPFSAGKTWLLSMLVDCSPLAQTEPTKRICTVQHRGLIFVDTPGFGRHVAAHGGSFFLHKLISSNKLPSY